MAQNVRGDFSESPGSTPSIHKVVNTYLKLPSGGIRHPLLVSVGMYTYSAHTYNTGKTESTYKIKAKNTLRSHP